MKSERRNLLLFSGGQSESNQPYFHYADDWLPAFLKNTLGTNPRVMYVPWALWHDNDADHMYENGRTQWERLGISVSPLHKQDNMVNAVGGADAIIVGGGSIHTLVKALDAHRLFRPIRNRVNEGALYIGVSAGSVIASPTRLTAMEPSLMQLSRVETLHLVPFQISPHYYDTPKDTHHSGPPPSARLRNYIHLSDHPRPVAAIKDGSCLQVQDNTIRLLGDKSMKVFALDGTEERIERNTDISDLLDTNSKYYTREQK